MKRNIYKELKQAKNIEEMARKISEITWCCADCSSDNREQCEKCLKDILSQNMEDIESPKSDKSGEYAIAYLNESGNGFSDELPRLNGKPCLFRRGFKSEL